MTIETEIRPITYLKSKAPDLLKQVNETRRHVIITQNGEPKAVLQDPESFEEMRDALTLMKMISQSEKAIREGKVIDNDEVFRDLEKRLKDR
ncbi:MAG: type II toxin-antitoxin system Phd/YefM family antitoxin [Proteobacteria bacterium]|nr:type II toxin-antitoxin system Phd/YefM family antitoxin [Pseudomonadota bacterium]